MGCFFVDVFSEIQEESGKVLELWAQRYPKSSTQFERDMINVFGQITEVFFNLFILLIHLTTVLTEPSYFLQYVCPLLLLPIIGFLFF